MPRSWQRLLRASQSLIPQGSAKRKIVQIIGIILFFQGVSIAVLSSHFGPAVGVISIALGVLILAIFPPEVVSKDSCSDIAPHVEMDTYGIRLLDYTFSKMGGAASAIVSGAAIVAVILIYNAYFSSRPDLGDLDVLTIILGTLLVAYPFVLKQFKTEATFALLFIGLVVVILVIPQAALSLGDGPFAGNWYVHYLLAAPFADALNLLGIEATSYASEVAVTFKDGSTHILSISTACAGLYSFSIFVSAFFSFVLVFEKLSRSAMVSVLSLGLLIAYLGNLFRMIVIGVIGYHYGIDALLWAHNNVGWMVFLSWSSVFWYAVMKLVSRKATPPVEGLSSK